MSLPPLKKRKLQIKKKFYQPNSKQYLEVGHKGFLATCNFDEKYCIRECYNILNEYANELYGIEDSHKDTSNNQEVEKIDDIADELQKQINATKVKKTATNRRFQVVDTGAPNCIFIKTTIDDPKDIVDRIVKDILDTKQQKTRHLLRLIPINAVCKANLNDIVNTAGQLCDKYFLKEHTTFSVVFNKRFNNCIDRHDIIREIWELIHAKNVNNKVDLKHAKRSLVIEVIKGLCCLAVVDDYMARKKYNLIELSKANHSHSKEDNTKQESSEKDERAKPCEPMKKGDDEKASETTIENNLACVNAEV